MKQQWFRHLIGLLALFVAFEVTSCSDDENFSIKGEVTFPEDTDVKKLDKWSYVVPIQIESDSEWIIEYDSPSGVDLCYASPESGTGNATVKLCVLDNPTDEQRKTDLYISFPKEPSKNKVISLCQKCAADYGENAENLDDGNRIYAIGYGYNYLGEYASENSVSFSPIVRIEDLESNQKGKTGTDISFEAKTFSGSSVTSLMNELSSSANFGGNYFGFKGEVGATFKMSEFTNNNQEYAISMVECAVTKAYMDVNIDEIIVDYMTNAAYHAINGLDYTGKTGRVVKTSYPNTKEGMKKLVRDYGTHLIKIARLGGKMKYKYVMDLTNVEGSYDLKAYANCSYGSKKIHSSANVADSLSNSYKRNSKSLSKSLEVIGGGMAEGLALRNNDNDANLDAWISSLTDGKKQTLVGLDFNKGLIPLYELLDNSLPDYAQRYKMLKTYILGEDYDFEHDAEEMLSIDMDYQTGTTAHLASIPKFDEAGSNTLIKDVYLGGQNVARVCQEFIPVINLKERVTVVYPVINNKPKYNMGYYVGDATHSPAKVCWDGNSLSVKPCPEDGIGEREELFIRGSNISSVTKDQILEADVEDAYMAGQYDFDKQKNYPIVKIFNNVWSRDDYQAYKCRDGSNLILWDERTYWMPSWSGQKIYYRACAADNPMIAPAGWKVASAEDYKTISATLNANGISRIADELNPGGRTGFDAVYEGWYTVFYMQLQGRNEQTEYWTSDQNHVRIHKDGTFQVEPISDEYYMSIRMIKE